MFRIFIKKMCIVSQTAHFFLQHFYKPTFWWAIQPSLCEYTSVWFCNFQAQHKKQKKFWGVRNFLVRNSMWKQCEREQMKIIFWGVTTFAWVKTIKFLVFLRFLRQNNAILCHYRTLCIIENANTTYFMRESAIFFCENMMKNANSQPGKFMYSL